MNRLAREERGFTFVAVMGLLLILSIFGVAAWAAANGDIRTSAQDRHRNAAYQAAVAGVEYYRFKLAQDNDYWTHCTNVPGPNGGSTPPPPVVQAWLSGSTDTRTNNWRSLPNGTGQYVIELLPAPGKTQCVENDQTSMIDPSTGTFKIRATGRVHGIKRSIIATFRHRGFLDYLYFTDKEITDPVVSGPCQSDRYFYEGRTGCDDITWATDDSVAGPFHTNDSILVCGSPTFGRPSPASDRIEIAVPSGSTAVRTGCSGSAPVFNPAYLTQPQAPKLDPPPSNADIKAVAASNYLFSGTTRIILNGSASPPTMTVYNGLLGTPAGSAVTMQMPANGVVYVDNKTTPVCTNTYDDSYASHPECGDVYIEGTYSTPLTIASANDVIVTNNITRASSTDGAVLGLVPFNFARIYHPCSGDTNQTTGASGQPGGPYAAPPGSTDAGAPFSRRLTIEAAILAVTHSFIVDNYDCGAPVATLTVKGAIGQKFRGPVGLVGTQFGISKGFLKDYQYDDRLRYLTPPYFLDPLQAPWILVRSQEQFPPR